MTSPNYDPEFAARLRNASAAVGDKPEMALTLANSDLTDGDIGLVGGFTTALETQQLVRLARQSGAQTSLTGEQRSQLDTLGEPYDDVDSSRDADPRNWLERTFDNVGAFLANTGSAIADLPGVDQLFTALDWLNSAAHLPARLISSGFDRSNDDEVDAAMLAHGYNPNSVGSYIAFMTNKGEALYHDLDGLRDTYGDQLVDLAIEQQYDPERFAESSLTRSPEEQELLRSPEFAQVSDLVDRQHVSPGRDIARALTFGYTDSAAFTAISGFADGAYTLLLDPTLMAGKVTSGVRALDASGQAIHQASLLDRATGVAALTRGVGNTRLGSYFRSGLRDATDQDGIRALLAVDDEGRAVTRVGAGVQGFLNDVKKFDETTDEAERAVIFSGLQARHRDLMPLFDEVRGKRIIVPTPAEAWATVDGQADDVIAATGTEARPSFEHVVKGHDGGHLATQGDPIHDLKDFADYFASTAGMLRLAGGAAAKREILLPGRVALRQRAAGRLAELRQTRAGARNAEVYDHSNPYRLLPHEAEENLQKALDDVERLRESGQIDAAEAARRGDLIYQEIRGQAGFIAKQRAKWEQRARRVSSLLPTVQAVDLTDARSIEQVRRFSRLYMNKAEADRLTSIYAAGDLGQRRTVLNGIIEQTLHASGLSRSETGLKEIERFRADQLGLDQRAYGLSRTDVIKTDAGPRHVALLPSQLNEKVLIPDFRSLQYLATKHAVGGVFTRAGHMRALGSSEAADAIIGAIKMGWITSAAGGFRNALDEIAGAVLKGDGPSLLRGRAAFSKAIAEGRGASAAERARGASLLSRLGWSIPRGLRAIPRTVNDVLLAKGLGRLMLYRKGELDDKSVKYANELLEDYKAAELDDVVTGTYLGDDALRENDEALAMHKAGLAGRPVRHNGKLVEFEFDGWGAVPVDGGSGLNALSNSLGMAFQDLTSPAHVALRAIINGGDAIADVAAYMRDPAMRHFLRNAERFKWTPSGKAVGNDPALLEQAIEQYAIDLIAHTTMLVAGRGAKLAEADELAGAAARYENDITQRDWWLDPDHQVGPVNPELAEMLQRGDIPDPVWLKENLDETELPSHAVGKRYAPVNPKAVKGRIASGYTEALAVGYDFFVTRQIRALSRNPMLTAAYEQARRNLEPYEQHLIEQGFAPEIAEQIARRSARVQAEQLVIKSIDDPTLSTQYAMLARNFHAFARAQEDWLRRWGRTIRDNPAIVRKGQLAIQGGESAGLLERDAEGNLIFTYPGSGLLIQQLGKLTSIIPGLPDMAKLPVVPDLTSRLIFLNPSLDNPIGFSGTPLVSIPFDILSSVTGADQTLIGSAMDRMINGELGAGRSALEKILPGFANRILAAIPDEDLGSQYGSAFASALANLEAAGRLDELNGSDPSAIARFQNDLKAQIANQMAMRAILGFFAPAAPSLPTNDTTDVETGESILKPDFVWEKAGLSSLREEARRVFGTMEYAAAQEWWAANHPGELVYQPTGASAQTIVGESDAQAPATVAAAKWLQDHPYLVDKYGGRGGLAAYFIPQGTPGTKSGEFSMDAYRAQLENGIREYKSLDELFEDIVIQRGEAVYFDTKDDVDAAIAEAIAAGNLGEVHRLEEWWGAKKQLIKAVNPLMAAKFADFATSGIARERTISQLNSLLGDERAVADLGTDVTGGIAELLLAQRDYQAARDAVAYERGYYATSRREEAKALFEQRIADVVARVPDLADLARGTFRVPD